MWIGIAFLGGFLFGLFVIGVCAAGGRADEYTNGYLDAAKHYENILEEKGLKKEGKWTC